MQELGAHACGGPEQQEKVYDEGRDHPEASVLCRGEIHGSSPMASISEPFT